MFKSQKVNNALKLGLLWLIYITLLYTFIQTNIEGTAFAIAFIVTTLLFLAATAWYVRKVIKKPDNRGTR
ncbi:hypothetical protein F9U64_14245 [Gracilibacillus oryzae]|uniref:Uncharacterized protein n=1 Tax=Gracilibacillus oryzae TaxID=1672701 RepID=A0A7C8L648_9BACI|nr:hypothetical protein [Gracilibacillus oryzae]KAB8130501.1 hypothetical protein F9U64_14245 [Gracilibacillus oryzae]